jgi:nucleotide-binding universal stress UspA family protein
MTTEAASPYAHIGCCVDDSAASRGALEEAVRLRSLGPGRLSVVHVAAPPAVIGYSRWAPEPEHFFHAARDWLAALVADVPGADAVLLWGDPGTRVDEWARGSRCDLLVAATHTGPVERTLFGSFSRHLAHHAPCPVLLTRPRAPSTIAAAVDEKGVLFADGDHGLTVDTAWTPEHLVLAAVARRAVRSLHARAAFGRHEVRGGRPIAPSMDAVRVSLDVEVVPPLPTAAALAALLKAAERDTNWAIPLARPVAFTWRVNGERVET